MDDACPPPTRSSETSIRLPRRLGDRNIPATTSKTIAGQYRALYEAHLLDVVRAVASHLLAHALGN
jgi:hypothetical protein